MITLFLRLGITAFGGPAAHIAMMHDETVERRKWLDDQRFMDLVGATNLIPGPNSTEMAIHIGYLRGGWRGLIVAGVSFILPAMLIVMGLAWVYVEFGTLPQADWLLYGVKPVVIAIIIQALWQLGPKAINNIPTAGISLLTAVLFVLGVNPLLLLFTAGGIILVYRNRTRLIGHGTRGYLIPFAGLVLSKLSEYAYNPLTLFLIFLKIGSVLYGSGYVLVAFLESDLVLNLGWLTQSQLLDAVAIGQVTPGPVFTTATFIGYLLGGVPGAILATLGIFLPSFLFVAISNPFIPRIRASTWAAGFLDGINASSLGLIAGAIFTLGIPVWIDPISIGLTLFAGVLLIKWRVNTTWLILGGGIIGIVRHVLIF